MNMYLNWFRMPEFSFEEDNQTPSAELIQSHMVVYLNSPILGLKSYTNQKLKSGSDWL